MNAETTARLAAAIPGSTKDIISHAQGQWRKDNVMRQIVNALAREKIEEIRTTLETCGPEELADLQGQIKAIKTFTGAINAQGPQ